jgi:hypothetical protein
MARRNPLPLSCRDAQAAAKCSSTEEAYANRSPAPTVGVKPAKGASFEAWLAYYEAQSPGGEFNELFAQMEVESCDHP